MHRFDDTNHCGPVAAWENGASETRRTWPFSYIGRGDLPQATNGYSEQLSIPLANTKSVGFATTLNVLLDVAGKVGLLLAVSCSGALVIV